MLKLLKTKLAALWHKLVNLLTTKERKMIMTLFARVEAIEPAITALQVDVAALKALPPSVDNTAAIAAVETKVDALAALVGTPAAPTA